MTIRRAVRFIAAAIFCAFIAFATLVIGVLIGDKADEAKAGIAAVAEVFHSGDTGQIIVALTGAPMALGCLLAPLAYGWALERTRRLRSALVARESAAPPARRQLDRAA